MSFTNAPAILPEVSIEELMLKQVSPKYRIINISINIVVTLFFLIGISLVDMELFFETSSWMKANSAWLYLGVVSLGLWAITYHVFADPIVQYAVREQDMHFQSGLFFRTLVSQPILRVQHIELKRGPIERKAGLATLQVFSAGGVAHTFEIPGLDYETAISLRKFIIDHKDLSIDE